MDVKDLRILLILSEELNFRKAAERLNMSQPPLTRLISRMEEELDVKLFTRTTRKVELTRAGSFLVQKAKGIIDALDGIEKEVRLIGKIKTGHLNIGLTLRGFYSEVPKLVSAFKSDFKSITTKLSEAPTNGFMDQLKTGKIDLGFSDIRIQDKGFFCQEVYHQELGMLVHKSHPLARKKSIRLSDLENETLIFHGKNDPVGAQTDFRLLLKDVGIKAKYYYKKPRENCLHLTVLEKGLLLASTGHTPLASSEVVYRPISDNTTKLRIFGVWSKENKSLPLLEFIHYLEDHPLTAPELLDSHSHLSKED